MSVKPILFNTEMVRAMLEGRKTCTRRVVKPQPKSNLCYTFAGGGCGTWGYPSPSAHEIWGEEYKLPDDITKDDLEKQWNPPCHTDDILYVRETWCSAYDGEKYFYLADKLTNREERSLLNYDDVKWHPSIHMPKEAARIWLKATDVRVERLQEITETQAQAEGCNSGLLTGPCTARGQFENLWNSTIKKPDADKYGWSANPWVWVIEFGRCGKSGKLSRKEEVTT
ncbi:MAG: hypothetical protein KHW89_03550 [Roseburia sp.]|nr:hypothetical protein [Roseburia sp.]